MYQRAVFVLGVFKLGFAALKFLVKPSVVTAVAEVETWLLRIDREDFFDLLADHSDVSRALFQALFKRARALLKVGLDSGEGAS